MSLGGGPVVEAKAAADLLVGGVIDRVHAHQQVEVIGHHAKTQRRSEVDPAQALEPLRQALFCHVAQHEAGQRVRGITW